MYKISVVLFLAAAVFSPHGACSQEKGREYPVSSGTSVSEGHGTHGTEVLKQSQASAVLYRPTENLSAALARRSGQSDTSAEGYQPTEEAPDKIGRIINQTVSLMQRSGLINSSTCGQPWKHPLAEIQGRIQKVEYRVQPFTGRTGLHIDVATGPETYTVIHVYPEQLTARCPSVFHFRAGDTVSVAGSEFFTGRGGMQRNICAAMMTTGEGEEDVLRIRDPQTGELERQVCCRQICEKNCIGLPPLCGRICAMNCERKVMKAVFQNLPFRPSRDKEYRTATTNK